MNPVRPLVVAALVLGATGCSSKCEKAVNNYFKLNADTLGGMAALVGKEPEEAREELLKKLEESKPQVVAQCEQALKQDPEKAEQALDCMSNAKDFLEAQRCAMGFIQIATGLSNSN